MLLPLLLAAAAVPAAPASPGGRWYQDVPLVRLDRLPGATAALRPRAGGVAAGDRIVTPYNARHYRQPSDAFDPRRTFAGPAQEATAAWALGARIARSGDRPGWKPGSDYAAIRARTDAARR